MENESGRFGPEAFPVEGERGELDPASGCLLDGGDHPGSGVAAEPLGPHGNDGAHHRQEQENGERRRDADDDLDRPSHCSDFSRYSTRVSLRPWSSHSLSKWLIRSPSMTWVIWGFCVQDAAACLSQYSRIS